MKKMKVVYIAGPFRENTHWKMSNNIRHAEEMGYAVALMGAMPLVPHKNAENYHGELTDEFWLEGTLELLRRCDAVLVIETLNHEGKPSQGVLGEIAEAQRIGIPVFWSFVNLSDWFVNLKE